MTPPSFLSSRAAHRAASAAPVLLSLFYFATAYGQGTPAADADVNRDGVVSQAEAEYSTSLRLEFDDLDRNRDGRLDPTEVTGLTPAPPGAVPVLPESAVGRAPGVVTSGSGTAGAAATTGAVPGSIGAARTNSGEVPGSAAGTPPVAPAVPGSSVGPATTSPFASPFATTQGTASGSTGGSAAGGR